MLSLCSCKDKHEWQSPHARFDNERWVAHAGGRINRFDYTNSLNALDASYAAGMHLFELDFQWTKDGHLVLLHDWDEALTNNFDAAPQQYTLTQFKTLKSLHGLTYLTAEELFSWLNAHPDAVIITDVKSDVLKALKWIQSHYPSYAEHFIPQIYHFEEYEPARKLGFYRVILTLYRLSKTKDAVILNFCQTHPVWAVTMPHSRAVKSHLTNDLRKLNIPVYVHTLNDPETIKTAFASGTFGIYIDDVAVRNERLHNTGQIY
jgi:glycerophosphoryl diester phosphodiesterase